MRPAQGGHTLPGLLAGLAGLGLLAGLAGGALIPSAGGRSAENAARNLSGRMRALSHRAAAEGRSCGLVFGSGASVEPLREAADGDGDGLSRADLFQGTDVASPAFFLARDFPGVRLGLPQWSGLVDLPPGNRPLSPADPPVRFGAAKMAVFDPQGNATAGSLFITDGAHGLWALVVNGSTARIQIWRFDRARRGWIKA